jgi:hypothetical protein
LNTTARKLRRAAAVALLFGVAAGATFAQTNKVFRCTGANGKVTLSDKRCPEDEAAKSDAKSAEMAASSPQARACHDTKPRLAERRRQAATDPAQRTALRELEIEQRRHCGA